MLHRGMVRRREHEAQPRLADALGDLLRPDVDLDAEAINTSAAPEREDSARLPCFATLKPAPAATKAAQVEML